MHVALLISGHSRSYAHNIQQIHNCIIQNHVTDLYIFFANNDDKYNNPYISLDKLLASSNMNIVTVIYEQEILFSSEQDHNILLNQSYKIYTLYQHLLQKGTMYDVVVRCRPDIYLETPLNFQDVEPNTIYIPNDAKIDKTRIPNMPYLCDGLAYGTMDAMKYYCSWHDTAKLHTGIEREVSMYRHIQSYSGSYKLIPIDYTYVLSELNVISISGDSGVGKSTISEALKELFKNPFILECDRYHKWERDSPNWKQFTHLDPSANFIMKMNNDIFDLKIGKTIYQVNYDHSTGKFTQPEALGVTNAETLIVCGLHSQYIDGLCDIKIYISASDNIKEYWKLQRDVTKRNRSVDEIRQQIADRKSDFIRYIDIQRSTADIVIDYYGEYNDIKMRINNYDYGSVNKIESLNIIMEFVRDYVKDRRIL